MTFSYISSQGVQVYENLPGGLNLHPDLKYHNNYHQNQMVTRNFYHRSTSIQASIGGSTKTLISRQLGIPVRLHDLIEIYWIFSSLSNSLCLHLGPGAMLVCLPGSSVLANVVFFLLYLILLDVLPHSVYASTQTFGVTSRHADTV